MTPVWMTPRIMQKISLEQLKIICKTLKEKFPNKDRDFYKLGLSTELLRIMVDNEWVNQSIFSMHDYKPQKTEKGRIFFKSEGRGFQYQERVRRLAERIFNLQNIKNIEDIVEKIKEGNLISRFSELEVGTTFYRRKIPFEFVKQTGRKRFDFDIKIKTNPEINCEVKNKIKSTILSEETLRVSLKKARDQMPKDEPSLIAVKIPEEWTLNKRILEIFPNVLDKFFKQDKSNNVVGVLFRWESRSFFHKGIFFWKYRLEKNPYSKMMNNQVREIFEKIESGVTQWIDFENVLNDC